MAGKSKQTQPDPALEPEQEASIVQVEAAESGPESAAETLPAAGEHQDTAAAETPSEAGEAAAQVASTDLAIEENQGAEVRQEEAITPEAGVDALAAGRQYLVRGVYDQAQAQFERALAAMEQAADQAGLAEVHEQLAITHMLRAEYSSAGKAYGRAREFRKQIADLEGEAEILRQLALLALLSDGVSG